MAYTRRKIYRPYRRTYTKKSTDSYQNSRIRSLSRRVSSLQKTVELKFNDVNLVNSVSNSGTISLLNGIAQGDDLNTRDGRDAIMKSVLLRVSAVKGDAYNLLRLMLVWDTDPDGSTPLLGDILMSTSNPIESATNTFNTRRFVVLRDKMMVLDTDQPVKVFKWFKKMNHKSTYEGTGSSILDIQKGALYLVQVSDSSAVVHPTVTLYSRLRFTS